MVINFGRETMTLCILQDDVGVVDGSKYLGLHINNRLNWNK